jgi:prenylcysteine alpha-carboxyl methylesterase
MLSFFRLKMHGISRSKTSLGFHRPRRSKSFVLPPENARSASAEICSGWRDAPYPRIHRGFWGDWWDFIVAIYNEIPILAPLASRLVRLLGLGFTAYCMLFRLVLFAMALSPALTRAGVWWWKSRSISRGIRYGPFARNFLDVYHAVGDGDATPRDMDEETRHPVVFYVTGGAWIIGYKAWAASLGEYLSKHGVIVVAVDYRNFPQGTLRDMIEDVSTAIDWTWSNIERFGGDRERITMVGQSAGAHILSNILLKRPGMPQGTTPISAWKKFIGVSGPYDIVSLAPRFNRRGLYKSMLNTIMDNDLFGCSPNRVVGSLKPDVVLAMPPILLLHGTRDTTVPFSSSVDFSNSLRAAGFENVELELWPGVSHSEPIVEGPAGGHNFFGSRVLLSVHDDRVEFSPSQSEPLMNNRMISFAKFVMPF